MNPKLPILRDRALFDLALTHRSYVNENSGTFGDNERLEFLGDAVLGFLVGEMLYQLYPKMNEAQLTHLRSRLVDEKQLGKLGAELSLGELMRLGRGAEKMGGRSNPSLLNDTFEAVIGAYFLDAGIDAVRAYVTPIFTALAREQVGDYNLGASVRGKTETFIDSKNRFQQWALSNCGTTPTYEIIDATGPDHAKQFTARVLVNGKVYGIGKGRRKQEAQKRAAEIALQQINKEGVSKLKTTDEIYGDRQI
ncbi:ribonuclease III [Myxosarcina sp. GI1]|uniref:ribonuclease III n=1 Tax=Myxosarcina sp. GI1 TaxID=1541065 RepID=UPI0005671D0D|nr:ribonuclease III [Myxosarcina sp. GI1]